MPASKPIRHFLAVFLCLMLAACGKGQTSQVDATKGQLTPAESANREKTDIDKAGTDLGVTQPQKPEPESLLSINAGPDVFSDANLLVNVQGTVSGTVPFARTVWTQIDGPDVLIQDPEQLNTQVLVPDVTRFTKLSFRLSGTTQDKSVASDTVDLFVYPLANAARVVSTSQLENISQAFFTVRLRKPATETTVLTYVTIDGTAIAGSDYVAASAQLTFAPGEQEKKVAITLLDDSTREKGEFFNLQVTGTEGDKLFSARGVAVIKDNESGSLVNTTKPTPTPSSPPTNRPNQPGRPGASEFGLERCQQSFGASGSRPLRTVDQPRAI